MSIATLKKKTLHKYNNSSVGHSQFSLNGGYRSQGFIGQTSLSRSLIKTPMKGNVIKGHGGKNGKYIQQSNFTSDIISLNDPEYIKNSVVSTEGMIKQRYKWVKRPLPFSVFKPKTIVPCKFNIVKDKIVNSCSKIRITTGVSNPVNCTTKVGITSTINCNSKIGTTKVGTKLSNGISCM